MLSTTVREPESKYKPAPEGLHQAVCVDVWDTWTEKRPEEYGGGIVDKTRIVWEIEEEDPETGKPFQCSQVYTASLHPKAKLRAHLESWRGRRFTDVEVQGFDLENLLGANAQVQVVHNLSKNGKTYANVQAVVPAAKGSIKLRASEGFVRKKDRTPDAASNHTDQSIGDEDVPF
jgi:hypothetical protein